MEVGPEVILAFMAGLILMFILVRLFLKPLKVVMKLVLNALLGALALLIANWIGGLFGFHIALNVYTAFIVGTLGIPGFILLVILKLLFGIV
ncbi:MAG: pro-sigmaK processing inhibitor BofA [Clostridiaceae bacterium]|jgi:inhibitor of the pro-sigma K processing machinery|nr:pro-sigmaK processing inhibitor BofA [Clostridiaceae bacterium]